jgi:hypothetical protein
MRPRFLACTRGAESSIAGRSLVVVLVCRLFLFGVCVLACGSGGCALFAEREGTKGVR